MRHSKMILIPVLLSLSSSASALAQQSPPPSRPAAPSSRAGSDTGTRGGGTIIRDDEGREVSADLYFQARNYQLPDYYGGPVQLDMDTRAELAKLLDFLKARNNGRAVFEAPLDGIEIQSVSRFSNQDIIEVPGHPERRQVAFALQFTQMDKNFTNPRVRRFIELDTKGFGSIDARNRAYIVLHELLHLIRPERGHEVISPFVKSLHLGLKLRDEAAADKARRLTEAEFDALDSLKNLTSIYAYGDPGVQINRQGGGLILCEGASLPEGWKDDENFVAMNSVVTLSGNPSVRRVSISGSHLTLDSQLSDQACEDAVFEDVYGRIICDGARIALRRVMVSSSFLYVAKDVQASDTTLTGDVNEQESRVMPYDYERLARRLRISEKKEYRTYPEGVEGWFRPLASRLGEGTKVRGFKGRALWTGDNSTVTDSEAFYVYAQESLNMSRIATPTCAYSVLGPLKNAAVTIEDVAGNCTIEGAPTYDDIYLAQGVTVRGLRFTVFAPDPKRVGASFWFNRPNGVFQFDPATNYRFAGMMDDYLIEKPSDLSRQASPK